MLEMVDFALLLKVFIFCMSCWGISALFNRIGEKGKAVAVSVLALVMVMGLVAYKIWLTADVVMSGAMKYLN